MEELRTRLIDLFSWMNEEPIDSGADERTADEVLAEISKSHDLVERCEHAEGYSYWECEACFEESYQRMIKAQEAKRIKEGGVRRYHMIPYTEEEQAKADAEELEKLGY